MSEIVERNTKPDRMDTSRTRRTVLSSYHRCDLQWREAFCLATTFSGARIVHRHGLEHFKKRSVTLA